MSETRALRHVISEITLVSIITNLLCQKLSCLGHHLFGHELPLQNLA